MPGSGGTVVGSGGPPVAAESGTHRPVLQALRRQAAVAVTCGRRTACLIWLIMGRVPGGHTDVLLPRSGAKLTRLEHVECFPERLSDSLFLSR